MFAPVAQYVDARPAGNGYEHFEGRYAGDAATDNHRRSPSESREDGQSRTDRPASDSDRDVVMVVCPVREPTAHDVITNLAAAYAEAGERVLVVTTTDLRSIRQVGLAGAGADARRTATTGEHADSPTQPLPVVGGGGPILPGGLPKGHPAAVQVEAAPRATHAPGAVSVEEVVAKCRPQRVSGVSMLQLGDLLRGPGEVATRGSAVVAAARQIADVVLVEAPGILATPDAEALVRCVDAVVVVAQAFHTTVGQATRSGELLRRSGAPTLGVVLTNVETRSKDLREGSSRVSVSADPF
jgi:Mrp family chromosome partitioning ATPase